MFPVLVSRHVRCPLPIAFAYLTDLENEPAWWAGVLESRCLTAHRGAGAQYRQRNRVLCVTFAITIDVTDVVPNERFVFSSTSGGMYFRATYTFTPTAAGTEITMTAETEPRQWLLRWLGPLVRRNIYAITEQNFDRLQRVLETMVAPGAAPAVREVAR